MTGFNGGRDGCDKEKEVKWGRKIPEERLEQQLKINRSRSNARSRSILQNIPKRIRMRVKLW